MSARAIGIIETIFHVKKFVIVMIFMKIHSSVTSRETRDVTMNEPLKRYSDIRVNSNILSLLDWYFSAIFSDLLE